MSQQVRAGWSYSPNYAHAQEAAQDILGEFLEKTGVPPAARVPYTCDVVGLGDNEGQVGSAIGKDWA